MSVRVPMINTIAIAGRLGRDPSLRTTSNGKSVARFAICHNQRQKDGDAWRDRPTWIDVVVWEPRAESVAARVHKGDPVVVTGRIEEERWERDGAKHSRIVIVASSVEPLVFAGGDAMPPRQPVEDADIPF